MGSKPALILVILFLWAMLAMAMVTWHPTRAGQGTLPSSDTHTDSSFLMHVAPALQQFDASSCQVLTAVRPHSGAIFRTGGLSNEGFGSFVQQLKLSAVAALYLNKTLIVEELRESEHGYSVPRLINEAANYTSDSSSRCNVTITEEHAKAMCAHMAGQKHNASLLQDFMHQASCTELRHHQTAYIPYETYNDCIQPWIQDAFRGIFKRRRFSFALARKECLNVGIHVRFGDLSTENLQNLDNRSIQLTDINIAVYNLKSLPGVCYNFYVFAKNPTPALRAQFQFDHSLLNSADDLYDIYVYSLMDIYIQGSSAFCVISSLIEPNRTIITNYPGYKYTFDYRRVSRVYHFYDDSDAYLADVRKQHPDYFRHVCNEHNVRRHFLSTSNATGNQR